MYLRLITVLKFSKSDMPIVAMVYTHFHIPDLNDLFALTIVKTINFHTFMNFSQYQCHFSFYTSTYSYLTCPPIAGLDHISRVHIPYALTTVVTYIGDSGMRTIGKQRTKLKHPLVFYMSISVCNEYRQDLAKPHMPLISCATPVV